MQQILPFMGLIQFRSVDIKQPDALLFSCYSSILVEVCLEGIAIDGFLGGPLEKSDSILVEVLGNHGWKK